MEKTITQLRLYLNADETQMRDIERILFGLVSRTRQETYLSIKEALITEGSTPRNEFLDDIITTAVESGDSAPWMRLLHYHTAESPIQATVKFNSHEDEYQLTHKVLESGLTMIRYGTHQDLWIEKETKDLIAQGDLWNDAGYLDFGCAMTVVQIALFGKVLY